VAVLAAPPLLASLPLDPAGPAGLRASAGTASALVGEHARTIPTLAQWIVDLVPANPVKAAADGALLPLIIFSILFGLACTRVEARWRESVVAFFGGVADASLVLVRWVLAITPLGVFALAAPLAARLGLSAAGALAGYVAIVSGLTIAFAIVVLYPMAAVVGGVPLGRFARAALPAQAVAFSSRSSLAALPAMIETARTRLGMDETVSSFFLPLAASTFRVGGAFGQIVGVLFIARLYGVPLDAAQLATIAVTVVLTTFSVPGVPAGSIVVMAPVLAAAGVPVEGIGILIGVDTVPDMFRTTGNVTADLAAATVLDRHASPARSMSRVEPPPILAEQE
jgi:Na+/H+-dicarboxylate symporter